MLQLLEHHLITFLCGRMRAIADDCPVIPQLRPIGATPSSAGDTTLVVEVTSLMVDPEARELGPTFASTGEVSFTAQVALRLIGPDAGDAIAASESIQIEPAGATASRLDLVLLALLAQLRERNVPRPDEAEHDAQDGPRGHGAILAGAAGAHLRWEEFLIGPIARIEPDGGRRGWSVPINVHARFSLSPAPGPMARILAVEILDPPLS